MIVSERGYRVWHIHKKKCDYILMQLFTHKCNSSAQERRRTDCYKVRVLLNCIKLGCDTNRLGASGVQAKPQKSRSRGLLRTPRSRLKRFEEAVDWLACAPRRRRPGSDRPSAFKAVQKVVARRKCNRNGTRRGVRGDKKIAPYDPSLGSLLALSAPLRPVRIDGRLHAGTEKEKTSFAKLNRQPRLSELEQASTSRRSLPYFGQTSQPVPLVNITPPPPPPPSLEHLHTFVFLRSFFFYSSRRFPRHPSSNDDVFEGPRETKNFRRYIIHTTFDARDQISVSSARKKKKSSMHLARLKRGHLSTVPHSSRRIFGEKRYKTIYAKCLE